MAINRLQDDLLQEFREEKKMVNAQIELFDPLALSLRKPAAQRLANKSLIVLGEAVCWILVATTIGFGVFMHQLYPYYMVFNLEREEYSRSLGAINIRNLQWGLYLLVALLALTFFFLARALRRIRLKNDVLNASGRHIKTLVGQHLQRKAAIDAIEQRHFLVIPPETPSQKRDVNEVDNPGYDPGK